VLAAVLALSLSRVTHAQSNERTLMHTFQEDSCIVYVTIVDRPPEPVGLVSSEDKTRQERWFMVSRAQFDKRWSTLMSAGVEKYAKASGDKQPERRFNAVNYYVFSAAEMPARLQEKLRRSHGESTGKPRCTHQTVSKLC
jgi:hypothetical protein